MTFSASIKSALVAAAMLVTVGAQATLVVDRGLPNTNLNNASGANRSNVAWAFNGNFLSGDDFLLGPTDPGKNWRIDKLSVWLIGGEATLGDRFSSISLFLGSDGAGVPKVATANLTGNTTDNADVTVSQVNYPGTADTYQGSSGSMLNIWQLDFGNLGTYAAGEYLFSVGGTGAPGVNNPLAFMHASNAALSGTPQDGSDDLYRWFSGTAADGSIAPGGFIDSDGNGWDKSSDINIQVYATQVPEPASLGLLGLGLLGAAASRRRSRA